MSETIVYKGEDPKDERNEFISFFKEASIANFFFLEDKYFFKFIETGMIGNIYIYSHFRNDTTGVAVRYDYREGLFANIIKLVNGKIGLYDPQTWFYVEDLLRKKRLDCNVARGRCYNNSNFDTDYISSSMNEYANILKKYGDAVLKGDFSIFESERT